MTPKNREILSSLAHWSNVVAIRLDRMAGNFRSPEHELPSELADIHAAIGVCQNSIQCLSKKIETLFESGAGPGAHSSTAVLTDSEIARLLALNLRLFDVTRHLRSVAEDVTPRLKAKLADPDDPMVDYEIEARLAFVLREDDSKYDENGDNCLTTRTESLKHMRMQEDKDFADGIGPKGLLADPHCWLFHDLYDNDHGIESPSLSLHDSLRIGRIFIDVQVWQQYDVDVRL